MSTTTQILQLITDLLGGGSDIVTKAEHKPVLDAITNSLLNKETDANLLGLLQHDPTRSYKILEGVLKDGQLWQANQAISAEAWNVSKWDQITGKVALTDYNISDWDPGHLGGAGYSIGNQVVRDERLWVSDVDSNTADPLVSDWTEISANDGTFGNNWAIGLYKQNQVVTDPSTQKLYYVSAASNFNSVDLAAEIIAGDFVQFNTSGGAGAVVFTPTINSNTMKEVSVEADFGTPVAGVISLQANTTYFIRGTVNCTNLLSINGLDGVSIRGWDRDSSKLAYTGAAGAGDFITIIDSSVEFIGLSFGSTNNTSGDVVLRAKNFNYFQSIPPTYDFYNLGRDKILTIINCQFRNCFDVQHIEGFDLVDIQNTLYIYNQSPSMGCHFKNVSKLQISSCEYVRWFDETSLPTPSGYALTPLFELLANGSGNGFGAVNISGSIFHPQQTQDGINISDLATIGFGTISANTGIDVGLTTGLVSRLDYDIQNSTIIQANQGIQNGNAKGLLSLTDNIIGLDLSNATPVGTLYSLPIADASFVGGAGPTNAITFPLSQRVTTSSTDGSFTYNSKIDGNFNVNLNATVTVESNGTYYIQVQFRQNGTPLPLIAKATIRNSNNVYAGRPIGLSIQGTATQGDVFDVLISIDNPTPAIDVLVSELIVNGYQF